MISGKLNRLLVSASALMMIGSLWFSPVQGDTAKKKALKIGVVNIFLASDKYERSKDLKTKIDDKIREVKTRIKKLKDERTELLEELKTAGPNRKEELKEKIQDKEDLLEVMIRRAEKKLKEKNKDYTAAIYQDLLKAIVAFGKEKGYDLILKSQESPETFISESEIAKQAATNTVLFMKPEFDITDAIVKRLNTAYRAAKNKEKKGR